MILCGHKRLKVWMGAGNFEACEGQVRFEGTAFRREAQAFHRALNLFCQAGKAGWGLKTSPEYARAFGVREKSEALDPNAKHLKTIQPAQGIFHLRFLLGRDLAQEFQRQVDPLGPRPTGVRAHGAKARLLAGESFADG